MRVLMLSKACIVGIYQRKLEEIARRNVDLLTLVPPSWRDERGEMVLERAYTSGYRLEVLPLHLNGNFHLHYYGGLGEQIRRFCPQIVHIDEEPYNAATWQALYHARRMGAKTLFFSWQNIHRRYPFPFNVGERWVLDHVDGAIAGTESAAQVWRDKGFIRPMTVIPQFGTDPDLFRPTANRPERPFTIGYVGRLVEEKGISVLLEAAAHLKFADWRLNILGSGPLLADLQAQTARLGISEKTIFQPQIPSTQIPAHYPMLDVLALPSLTRPNWKEQFGRTLVEAMASGVPVIGSDSGAIPDVIGDVGTIVSEGDAAALAAAITRLYDDQDLADGFRLAGRQRVIDHFTHAQVAAATVDVYRALLAP